MVNFRGRDILVVMPHEGQLVVWRRVVARLEAATTGAQVAESADRAIRFIESVMALDVDRRWLEDQMLDGALKLEQAADLIGLAVAKLRGMAPTPAPKTGPPPRARRR